ncbi:Lar family restriction alleviation protein [Acidovorax sp.]|uniref:Lar family restriction alleviation protein n=1 Tax=Acidovorax sp. TaxID=1872122 RepID=UPI0031D0FC5B
MTEPTPLPCPFCGSSNVVHYEVEGRANHHFECCECLAASMCKTTYQEALAAWNRRTPQPTQAQAGAVPLMYLPPLITAQINHLRNTAYRDGADGEPTGLLDKVHERLGAIILTELNKARQQSTPAHGIKGGQHG